MAASAEDLKVVLCILRTAQSALAWLKLGLVMDSEVALVATLLASMVGSL